MLYKIIILQTDSHGPYSTHYDVSADWTNVQLWQNVRGIVDALRGLGSNGSTYEAALVLEVDGPITAQTTMRVFQAETTEYPIVRPFRDAGQSGTLSRFVGLKTFRNRTRGRAQERLMLGCVSGADIAPSRLPHRLSIVPEAPCITRGWNWYSAFMADMPELDNVYIETDGTAEDQGALLPPVPVYASYLWKAHAANNWLSADAVQLNQAVNDAAFFARRAVKGYEAGWSVFNHRWGDNHFPNAVNNATVWNDALYAASIWQTVAEALGYTIYDRNDAARINALNAKGVPCFGPVKQWGGLHVKAHNGIVLSCVQSLYNCERAIQAALSGIHDAKTPDIAGNVIPREGETYHGPYWVIRYFDDQGRPRSEFGHTWPPPYERGALVAYTPCEAQQEYANLFETQWGGTHYADTFYNAWPVLSSALHQINRACHLLLAYLKLQSRPHKAHYHLPGLESIGKGVLKDFQRRPIVDSDWWVIGPPCDFREYRPLTREPYLRRWFPCKDPVGTVKKPIIDKQPPHCKDTYDYVDVPQFNATTQRMRVRRACDRDRGTQLLDALNRKTEDTGSQGVDDYLSANDPNGQPPH